MAYPAEINVLRMDSTNESIFVHKLKELEQTDKSKNKDWWPNLIVNYKNYDQWYLAFHKEEIISFSCVQLFGKNTARLATRLWNGVKKNGLERGVILNEVSPAMIMIEMQLKDYKNYNAFFSMQQLNRRKHLEKLAEKLNIKLGRSFKLNDGMYQTCPYDVIDCWQSTISEKELNLPEMPIEEWKEKYV